MQSLGQEASFHSARESFTSDAANQGPDTVVVAVLLSQRHLPERATVRDCLKMYCDLKLKQIDDLRRQIDEAFEQRLREAEDELLGDSVPVNSEENNS